MPEQLVVRLRDAKTDLGLQNEDLATLLLTSERTLEQWLDRDVVPAGAVVLRLHDFLWIVDELRESVGAEDTKEWLFSPCPDLAGRSPAAMIEIGCVNEVFDVLTEMTLSAG